MKDSPRDPSSSPFLAAIEENLFAAFRSFQDWPRLKVHDEPEYLWTISDIPCSLFNSVLRANLAPGRVDAAIEAAIDRCRSRHVPMLWWTGPATQPSDLAVHLAAKGFQGEEEPGMAVLLETLPVSPPPPSGFIVERVTDLDALAHWCRVCCEGFGIPNFTAEDYFDLFRSLGLAPDLPWRHYLGWLEGEPVATSSLFLSDGAAGIYNVATLPRARRRGFGAAMTATALGAAQAGGYPVAILQASEMGAGVYRSLGFDEFCKIGQYVWTG